MTLDASDTRTLAVLDVPIAQVTYADVLDTLAAWRRDRPAPARTLIAANVHVVTEAALHPDFHAAVMNADLVVPDGMPLVWATRQLGGTLSDRCYGPTLMERALERFQADGARHFFYGSTPETLARLEAAVAARWPGAVIAGALAPSFGPFDDAVEHAHIARIDATAPDFLWIAMGCPKQELWMRRYRSRVHAAGILAVGAAFDFIAGTVRQAPPWMQKRGLEWLYRLAVEPRRLWRRYLIRNPYFIYRFTLQRLGLG